MSDNYVPLIIEGQQMQITPNCCRPSAYYQYVEPPPPTNSMWKPLRLLVCGTVIIVDPRNNSGPESRFDY